jgi:hypothetical protein
MMRLLQAAGFIAGLVVVFFLAVRLLPGSEGGPQGNIRIVSRLDEYTRQSNPQIANTIPTFLTQPGQLGAVPPDPAAPAPAAAPDAAPVAVANAAAAETASNPTHTGSTAAPAAGANAVSEEPSPAARVLTTRDVKPVDEIELQKGFCTATLVKLVRQQYPGSYDNIPDEELEKTLLDTRPEYRDRVCVLPVWIEAHPHDIVKYELEAGPLGLDRTKFFFAGLVTAVAALTAAAVLLKIRH